MSNHEPGGLFANGQRVPLCGVQIDVKAAGAAARVSVAQRYHNAEKVPVEAVYSFPLDESCAVCGFEVEIGGKRIVGKVEEREKAFEKYDEAMAQGHGAFLVDQDRPNIFTASVGNLLPGQEAVVRLAYATELEQSGDTIRVLVPTTISPRYIPAEEAKKMDPAELDHITPPTIAGAVPYGLKLTVELEAAADVREVSCPSHPAKVSMNGRSVKVELMGENIQLDRDFVLNVALAKPHEPSAVVARDGDGVRAVMLNLFPDLSNFRRGPAEFIFVIDRSGSMDGPSIAQARNALLVALRSLESGDRFNVIGFGDKFETLFKESVAYSQDTLDEASRKLAHLKADLGGTEMLAPLQHALEGSKKVEGMQRILLLLTDGQIGNEAACLELAQKHAECRIFTFGVGHGVSEHLLRGLARASGGQAEFIHPNERIEPKVLKQIGRIAAASITNVRIDWGKLKTDLVAPAETPQLYNGDRFTVYARVIGGAGGEVAVLADSPGGALRFPVNVDLERALAESAIPVLMARKAIQELEEGRGEARGSSQQNRKQGAAQKRILELALRYQLMSSATSFVAVEERAAGAQTEAAQLRRIPVALTKGWGGEGESSLSLCMTGAAPGTAVMAKARMRQSITACAPRAQASPPAPPAKGGGIFQSIASVFSAPMMKMAAPPSAPPPSANADDSGTHVMACMDFDAETVEEFKESAAYDELLALTLAQKADGSFEASDDFLRATGITREKLTQAARKLAAGGAGVPARDAKLSARIVATLLALEILEQRFAARKDEWKMLADKARRWLAAQKAAVPSGFSDLQAWRRAETAGKS